MKISNLAAAAFGLAMLTGASAALAAKPGYSKTYDACMAKGKTTYDMDVCNGGELKVRNAALNAAYARTLHRVGAGSLEALKVAERAWIAYRDADCGIYANRAEFGTFGTIQGGTCLIDRTIERTKALEQLAPDESQPG